MAYPTLSVIDNAVQLRLRNIVNSPLSQSTRVEAYNRVIDFLQSKANWNATKKVAYFNYLQDEVNYSLSNDLGISDFKQIKDLRFVNDSQHSQLREFEEVNGEDFAVLEGQRYRNNRINFEDKNGEMFLKILTSGGSKTLVDEMSDLTTGRTWSADTITSDATNIVQDTNRVKTGSACISFDIDVSQSGNNRATIYTSTSLTTALDASDELNLGFWRLWAGLQNLTATQLSYITSVTFVWGTGTSITPATKANYWSYTATVPSNVGAFVRSWNRMSFPWSEATKTGSPDESAITYFEITINYSASMTDATSIRMDEVTLFNPAEMEFVYFSTNFVNNEGTWQDHFSTGTIDTNEILLLPNQHLNLFINLALMELFPQKDKKGDDYIRVKTQAMTDLDLAINQSAEPITREESEFEVDGASSGRDDTSNNQW